MATLKQIRDKADAQLTQFWGVLTARQDAYFTKHGEYIQLLLTDRVVDGEDTTLEIRHHSGETHAEDIQLSFNSPISFQISVGVWGRYEERGYSATVTIELLNGRKFSRTRQHTNEDTGWQEIIEE